jgi:uncharacterized iron-regulated protein
MRYFFFTILMAVSVADAQAPATPSAPAGAPQQVGSDSPSAHYVPHRAFEARSNRFSDFETMLAQLAKADIVFLGEKHDDPGTHRLQLAILQGLDRRREGPIVLALEMFERDVQPALDAYLTGSSSLEQFLATSRPWPNNAADYQPLVDYARAHNWPVVAGNVPRRLAQAVSRRGLGALDSLAAADRAFFATELSCPHDEYWRRFKETMGDMSGHGVQMTPDQVNAMVQRFYEAQCVKDETMGEAIAQAHGMHGTLVVHANGSFHSDYRLGTVERVKRRLPRAKVAVVSFVPVPDLDRADGRSRRKLGDWVVFTLEAPKPAAP